MTETSIEINPSEVDFTELVGREIRLRTEQFDDRILTTRVMGISDHSLVIDRSGSSGRVGQLVPHQKVNAQFDHRGQPAGFESQIVCPNEGRMVIPIADRIIPVHARRFVRFNMTNEVQLALFDARNITAARLNKLKWLKTSTANISAGGMLAVIPGIITGESFMILHLPLEGINLPRLIVGRTRYFIQGSAGKNKVGVEFIVKEDKTEKLPNKIIRNLPEGLFEYTSAMRKQLCDHLKIIHDYNEQGDIG